MFARRTRPLPCRTRFLHTLIRQHIRALDGASPDASTHARNHEPAENIKVPEVFLDERRESEFFERGEPQEILDWLKSSFDNE